ASAAQALFAFNLVLMLGYLALGWSVPGLVRRGWTTLRLVAIGTALMLALELAIAFAHGSWAWVLWLALAAVATVHTLAQTHVSLSFPERLTGRAFSASNLLATGGMFLAQWLFGVTVDAFGGGGAHGAEAFRHAMLVWVAVQAVALLVLLSWRVQPPKGGTCACPFPAQAGRSSAVWPGASSDAMASRSALGRWGPPTTRTSAPSS